MARRAQASSIAASPAGSLPASGTAKKAKNAMEPSKTLRAINSAACSTTERKP